MITSHMFVSMAFDFESTTCLGQTHNGGDGFLLLEVTTDNYQKLMFGEGCQSMEPILWCMSHTHSI